MTDQSLGICDVQINRIVEDRSLQIRCQIDPDQIDNLKDAFTAKDHDVPAIELFSANDNADGELHIGDGWHRFLAAKELRLRTIRARISNGGRAAALKYALGANAAHGLRRTNKDKRRAVEVAGGEFPHLSNRAIADLCKVDHKTVAAWRKESTDKRTGQDGKTYPAQKSERQLDFFDQLKRECSPIFKGLDALYNLPLFADHQIDPSEKVKGLQVLRDNLKRYERQLKDLEESIAGTIEGARRS